MAYAGNMIMANTVRNMCNQDQEDQGWDQGLTEEVVDEGDCTTPNATLPPPE